MNSPQDDSEPQVGELTRLQQELAEAETVRERLVAEHQRQLEELRNAVAVRDEFIAIAAHELRNPMSAIVLSVQNIKLATERSPEVRPARLEAKLEALEKRIHHYVRRASLLLDVTRLTSGKFELEYEPVDLSQLTREVADGFAEESSTAQCPLEVRVQDGIVGQWDRLGLEQVLMNLVSNAVKYGAGKPVSIRLHASADWATLEVSDAGMGISLDDQERIFEKFERAVRRRQHGGFGMGLWITRQIVERLGGTIRVRSKPGLGSSFTVSFPGLLTAT
jgi:two-component system, OmpR family, sensor kinase